ncbi:MAG TPA: hypothetical protein VN446_07395 [Candidatus Acidoferrum sp.]|nr:hypothetical protein [Candidatus Acidoferrum sp.]
MDFSEWSKRKKEQREFELWSDEKARAAQPASYDPPYMGAGESLRLGAQPTQPTHWESPKRPGPADVYVTPEKALAPSYPGITTY